MARAPNKTKTDSVFDFLYVDHKRIGLYLSQFSDFGNLTDIVLSRTERSDVQLRGGIPGVVSGATTGEQTSGIERRFDTQWSQVLNFLDETHSRKMLRTDVNEAPLGSLLLVSGALYIVNMQPFAKTFGALSESPTEPARGNRKQRRATRASRDPDQEEDMSGLRILASLEQPIFAILRSGEHRIWSMLNPDFLIGGSNDINLKHGIRVTGEWHMLGIVDCEPGSGDETSEEIGRICGGGENEFSSSAIDMWHEFRQVFGRPDDCWGLTPLVVMRELT